MPKLFVTDQARDDIAMIFARIAPHNFNAALRVNEAIEEAFEVLLKNPGIGTLHQSNDPAISNFRYWPLKKYTDYLVIYRPHTEGIDIVRVYHGAQDITRLRL